MGLVSEPKERRNSGSGLASKKGSRSFPFPRVRIRRRTEKRKEGNFEKAFKKTGSKVAKDSWNEIKKGAKDIW